MKQTMRGSLGLAAYRALMRRGAVPDFNPKPDRPVGELVWLNFVDPKQGRAVVDLAARLIHARPDLSVLVTMPEEAFADCHRFGPPNPDVYLRPAPSEHPDHIKLFLDHWQPDMLIWVWGGLRPNLIVDTQKRGIPMILIDAGKDGFDSRRDRWMPEVPRQVLAAFDAVLARSQAAHARLAHLGQPSGAIEMTAPLLPTGQALPVNDAELDEVSGMLSGRPIWLAAHVAPAEVPAVMNANRRALRLSHRLLLIAQCEQQETAEKLRDVCTHDGLRCCVWSEGDIPDDGTQVIIADEPGSMGLWYRVAPVAFLGQSLLPSGIGTDPYAAASLGTAVLYGPHVRGYLPAYTRLANAGAARIVKDGETLGDAVSQLIAPDLAASMAMAGWDTITEGAAVVDRVTDLMHNALDARIGARN